MGLDVDSADGTWTATAPVLPVRDVVRSAEFYCRHLGFPTAHLDADGKCAIVRNGRRTPHLTQAGSEQALRAARGEHVFRRYGI
jgi:hypothetical protein